MYKRQPEEWLKPYTDETLIGLAKNGTKKISIISPGFVTDCLETLDEIKNEALETFQEHGGKNLNYINCLNDGEEGISLLSKLIQNNIKGWN